MRRAVIGACLLASVASAASLPAGALKHLPTLSRVYQEHWPAAPLRHIAAGQVEQESSWNERATLRTSRELGRGLVQMTVTPRFNVYLDAVRYRPLADWDWERDPYNPGRQLTFLVLQDRANWTQWRRFSVDATEAWKMALVSYNAGPGRVVKRRQYAAARGLPPDRWTAGLEDAHGPLEDALLYGRPLWAAVNEYPRVIFSRARKYEGRL